MSPLRWLIPALLDRQHARPGGGRRRRSRPFVGHRMAEGRPRARGARCGAARRGPLARRVPRRRARPRAVRRLASASSATRRRSSRSSRGYLDEGYVRIKIKIKPGRDVAETAAVRDAFGAHPAAGRRELGLHARRHADTLAELDRFDLLLIEQPLQEDDLVDHATLARRLRTPVCLDESIVSREGRAPTRSRWARHPSSTSRRAASAATSRRCAIHDLCAGCRHPGVVRRHARDRHRPGRERRARGAARLHAAGRRVGLEPLLRPRHRDRARRARGRARARADRPGPRRRDRPDRARGLHRRRARPCGGR